MAHCKKCGAPVPQGTDYCEKCITTSSPVTDESYLDSLLSSVTRDAPKREVKHEKHAKQGMHSVSATGKPKTASDILSETELFADDEFSDEALSDTDFSAGDSYSIFDNRSDEDYLDQLFEAATSGKDSEDYIFEEKQTRSTSFKRPDFIERMDRKESSGEQMPDNSDDASYDSFGDVLSDITDGTGINVPENTSDDMTGTPNDITGTAGDIPPYENDDVPADIPVETQTSDDTGIPDDLSDVSDLLAGFNDPVEGSDTPGADTDGSAMDIGDIGDIADLLPPEEGGTEDIPDGDIPNGDIPDIDIPNGDIPDIDIPDGDIPETDSPEDTPTTGDPGDIPSAEAPEMSTDTDILNEVPDVSDLGIDSDILDALGVKPEEIGAGEAGPYQNGEDKLKNEDDLELAGMLNEFDSEPDVDKVIDSIDSGDFEKELNELIPEEEKKKKKKKKKQSLFQRLFGNIKEDLTPEQLKERYEKEQAKEKERKEAEAKKKEEAKLSKEENKKRKAEEAAENKTKAAAEKAEKDAKARADKAAKEEAKRKKKQEKLALAAQEIPENVGKINKKGAMILLVFFAVVTLVIIFGTQKYSYDVSIKSAGINFERQRYNEAYKDVYGLEIKDEDIELYDKILTVMYVNKQLNSYNNYMRDGMKAEALDSLIKGLGKYEKYQKLAVELGIQRDLDYVRDRILTELSGTFGIDENRALTLARMDNQPDYTMEIFDYFN